MQDTLYYGTQHVGNTNTHLHKASRVQECIAFDLQIALTLATHKKLAEQVCLVYTLGAIVVLRHTAHAKAH